MQLDYVRAQHPDQQALDLVHEAVRLSSNVIAKDFAQFASQVVGSLLPHKGAPAIDQLTATLIEGAPNRGFGR